MIMRTFDFCLKFCHLTLFSPHPLPPTYQCFQLLAAALQENKASFFVNVTHSRLRLLSFEIFVVLGQVEANFHYFTFYLHSAVVLRNEYIR